MYTISLNGMNPYSSYHMNVSVLPRSILAAFILLVAEANVLILLLLNGFVNNVTLSLPLSVLPFPNGRSFICKYGGKQSLISFIVCKLSFEPSAFLCKKAILAFVVPNKNIYKYRIAAETVLPFCRGISRNILRLSAIQKLRAKLALVNLYLMVPFAPGIRTTSRKKYQ